MLKPVTIISTKPNSEAKYIKSMSVIAERDGKQFSWEVMSGHESVHVMVNNTETKEFLFVKQVRIPVMANNPGHNGEVLEVCAGLVDKDIPTVNIAQEEILEELGYAISTDKIEFVRNLKTSVGRAGSNSFVFYAEVTESNKVSDGGGLHDEDIEVVRIKYEDLESIIFDDNITTDAMTVFLVTWALKFKI